MIARVSGALRRLGEEARGRRGRADERGAAAEAAASPVASTAQASTVLVVDDDPAVRLLVAEALRASGCMVLEAADGEEAMALSARHDGAISLLISDLVMPRMGGRELAKRITATRPATPVLFISGSLGDAGLREQLRDENAAFLAKPFDLTSLMAKVHDCFGPPE